MSGTGTVREHVQRLGRILRPSEGKQAMLYELVAQDTYSKSIRVEDAGDMMLTNDLLEVKVAGRILEPKHITSEVLYS